LQSGPEGGGEKRKIGDQVHKEGVEKDSKGDGEETIEPKGRLWRIKPGEEGPMVSGGYAFLIKKPFTPSRKGGGKEGGKGKNRAYK